MDTYRDKEIEDRIKRLKEEEDRRKRSWWNNIPFNTKLIFTGLGLFILYWIWQGQQTTNSTPTGEGLSISTGVIILILVVVGLSLLGRNPSTSPSEKSHLDLMKLLKSQLEEMQRTPLTSSRAQLPQGEIQIEEFFNSPTSNERPFRKQTSVALIRPNGQRKWYKGVQDTKTGDLLDLEGARIPFRARDKKIHKTTFIPPKLAQYKQYEDYVKGMG